jgi:pimeloyl-ACP methyl ester carboxylesterase
MKMQIEINSIPVYYEIHGEGRPLVCIHGFTPDHHLMTGCMEPIFTQRDGWQRIYLDLPGMGKTPALEPPINSDAMLALVWAFIDAVIPGQSFALAGESYGGYLSEAIVYHHPERVDGLLLLCPLTQANYTIADNPPKKVLVRDEEFLSTLPNAQREGFEAVAVVQTRENWERTVREVNVGLNVCDYSFTDELVKIENYVFASPITPLPEPYDKPTLMLLGKQDHMVGYKETWKIYEDYPRASFVVLDRAGHGLQIEQAGLFNALVHEWLDRVEEFLE